MSLADVARYVADFYFNMRDVHFFMHGKGFLEIHEYAQELYEQAEEYYDDLIETAIDFGEDVVSMKDTEELSFSERKDYDYANAASFMQANVSELMGVLEFLDETVYPSFIYSKIDSMLEWLDKQNYKLTQMSKEI